MQDCAGPTGRGYCRNLLNHLYVHHLLWSQASWRHATSSSSKPHQHDHDVLLYCAGSGQATVAKLQVGLLGSARSLQRDLERIAGRADTNTPDGLHYVLQGKDCRTAPFAVACCAMGCEASLMFLTIHILYMCLLHMHVFVAYAYVSAVIASKRHLTIQVSECFVQHIQDGVHLIQMYHVVCRNCTIAPEKPRLLCIW